MIPDIDDQLRERLREIRGFLLQEIVPLEPMLLQQHFELLERLLQEKRKAAKEIGLWTPHLPASLGGPGYSLYQFAYISEVLGFSPLGHYACNCQAPDIGNMELLLAHGNAEQQQRYLHPLVNGETRSCFAMTEPEHAGSNPVWLSTTATKDGDSYVIDGHKWFASSAEGADFIIVMAVTNPEAAKPHHRASMLLVPADTPGVKLIRNIPVMGEHGRGYFSHAELRFEGCRVPEANRIGQEGEGFALAQQRLGPGRIHHCMRWLGICERAFAMMCDYALKRELAPGHTLAEQQAIQHWIAESRAEIDAARMLVLATAAKIDREGARAARHDISMIKFHVANVLQQVLDRAIQSHGALGVTDDTILSFFYRHERAARIYDGPDEVHKSYVARHLLRSLAQ